MECKDLLYVYQEILLHQKYIKPIEQRWEVGVFKFHQALTWAVCPALASSPPDNSPSPADAETMWVVNYPFIHLHYLPSEN